MNNKNSILNCAVLSFFLFSFFGLNARAAVVKSYKFWVEFTDKIGTPYLISRPEEYLSRRSLERRAKAGVAVNWDDLPPNPIYIETVKRKGVKILLHSRWMNAVLVETADSALSSEISGMATVKRVELMGVWENKVAEDADNSVFYYEPMALMHSPAKKSKRADGKAGKNKTGSIENNYGDAYRQIEQLNGQELHRKGYRGKGVLIAVLDAGFYRAHEISAFDSLRNRGGILKTFDFVTGNSNVFNDDDHGTEVLSCMAANEPGMMIGTAPDANYILLRTEDAGTEFPCEEANWIAAAELADSMGADLINASVGYTEFDMQTLGHSYAELDGKTTLITRAANEAWKRGIFVVTSAGNEGDGRWQYIGAPADAEGAIAVAAVDKFGERTGFSSIGPTADSRVKPDLAALGEATTVASPGGYYTKSNGTSFSSPVLAGMIACAIHFLPAKKPAELKQWILMTGSSFPAADNKLGYGLPDFSKLLQFAAGTNGKKK